MNLFMSFLTPSLRLSTVYETINLARRELLVIHSGVYKSLEIGCGVRKKDIRVHRKEPLHLLQGFRRNILLISFLKPRGKFLIEGTLLINVTEDLSTPRFPSDSDFNGPSRDTPKSEKFLPILPRVSGQVLGSIINEADPIHIHKDTALMTQHCIYHSDLFLDKHS